MFKKKLSLQVLTFLLMSAVIAFSQSVDFARDFDATGDGVAINDEALREAIAYCQENHETLVISADANGGRTYRFAGPIVIDKPINIICDDYIIFWWKNVAPDEAEGLDILNKSEYAITFTSANQANWPYLAKVELPFLRGPAIERDPVTNKNKTNFSNLEHVGNGIAIKDIFGFSITLKSMVGFGDAISIISTDHATANNDITVTGPMDNNNRAIVVRNDPDATAAIGDCKITVNTLNSRENNIYLYAADNARINNVQFFVNSMYSIHNADAIIDDKGREHKVSSYIYGDGNQRKITYCTFDIGYTGLMSDGTDGTDRKTQQIIGGNAVLNDEPGYFDGYACTFQFIPGDLYSGGISGHGDPILLKVKGERCNITCSGLSTKTFISLSTSPDEGDYCKNNSHNDKSCDGYGSASCAKRMPVSMTGTWAPGETKSFYAFSQLLTARQIRPINYITADGNSTKYMKFQVTDLSYSVNRQIRITATNTSEQTLSNVKLLGWLVID